jgi:hypothetical protein
MSLSRKIMFTIVFGQMQINIENCILSQMASLTAVSSFGLFAFRSLAICPDPRRNQLTINNHFCKRRPTHLPDRLKFDLISSPIVEWNETRAFLTPFGFVPIDAIVFSIDSTVL